MLSTQEIGFKMDSRRTQRSNSTSMEENMGRMLTNEPQHFLLLYDNLKVALSKFIRFLSNTILADD